MNKNKMIHSEVIMDSHNLSYPSPKVIKLFVLNSAKHEIFLAHKCFNCCHFNIHEHEKFN